MKEVQKRKLTNTKYLKWKEERQGEEREGREREERRERGQGRERGGEREEGERKERGEHPGKGERQLVFGGCGWWWLLRRGHTPENKPRCSFLGGCGCGRLKSLLQLKLKKKK